MKTRPSQLQISGKEKPNERNFSSEKCCHRISMFKVGRRICRMKISSKMKWQLSSFQLLPILIDCLKIFTVWNVNDFFGRSLDRNFAVFFTKTKCSSAIGRNVFIRCRSLFFIAVHWNFRKFDGTGINPNDKYRCHSSFKSLIDDVALYTWYKYLNFNSCHNYDVFPACRASLTKSVVTNGCDAMWYH